MSGRTCRVLAASVLVTALAGPAAFRPAQAATARVTMADMKFTPDRLDVSLGDTVVWLAGDDDHTVTARDGSFDSSARGVMAAGDEFRWRFRVPGQYPYFCRIHGSRGMQGVVVVTDPSAPTTTTTAHGTPVTAAATTSTTPAPVTTTAPTTTTTRLLATSSTTSVAQVVATTAPPGVAAVPQEPPVLNLASPAVGSGPGDAGLSETSAASRRPGGSPFSPAVAAAAGGGGLVLAVLAGGLVRRSRRRRSA
jgi:plastocyanin